MTSSGKNWKWPERDDVLWYDLTKDFVKKIQKPKLVNKRGNYEICDMNSVNISSTHISK